MDQWVEEEQKAKGAAGGETSAAAALAARQAEAAATAAAAAPAAARAGPPQDKLSVAATTKVPNGRAATVAELLEYARAQRGSEDQEESKAEAKEAERKSFADLMKRAQELEQPKGPVKKMFGWLGGGKGGGPGSQPPSRPRPPPRRWP